MALCCSICAEEKAQILDPLMCSRYFTKYFFSFRSFPLRTVIFLFTELDAVLQHLGQGVVLFGPYVIDTSDTSVDESEDSHPRRRVRSKRT